MRFDNDVASQMRSNSKSNFINIMSSSEDGLTINKKMRAQYIEDSDNLQRQMEEERKFKREQERQRLDQVAKAKERINALSSFTEMPIDTDGIAKPLKSAEDDLYKNPLDELYGRAKDFNNRLILNLNTTEEMYRKIGLSEKDIAERMRPSQVDNIREREELYNKLKSMTYDLKEGEEGFFQGIKEQSRLSTIQNMLSKENRKAMLGQANNADLIEAFLEGTPELYDEKNSFLSAASRGFVSMGILQANNMNEALKDPKTLVPIIGAGLALAGLTIATGGGALLAGGLGAALGGSALAMGSAFSTYEMLGMGAAMGMSFGVSKMAGYKMYERTAGDIYAEGIKEGLAPSVARANAMASGTVSTLIEYAQLDAAGMARIPGMASAVDTLRKKSLKITQNKLAQIAMTIGGTVVSESLEEATQQAVEDFGMNLSKRMNGNDTSLIKALTTNPNNIPLFDNFDVYADVFKESMRAMAFAPLIPVAGQLGDFAVEAREANKIKAFNADERYKASMKSFITEGGVERFYDGINDPNLSQAQKLEIARCSLDAVNACDLAKSSKDSIFGKGELKEIEDLRSKSQKVFEDSVKNYKAENPDFKAPDSTLSGNRTKLVEGLANGDLRMYENFTPVNPDMNLQVANRFIEASNMRGLVDSIEDGFTEGKSKAAIASEVVDILPRRIKNQYKSNPSGLSMEAMKYVNAVDIVNNETRIQADKAKFTALERMGYNPNSSTVEVEAGADNINRQYDLNKRAERILEADDKVKEDVKVPDAKVEAPKEGLDVKNEVKPLESKPIDSLEIKEDKFIKEDKAKAEAERRKYLAKGYAETLKTGDAKALDVASAIRKGDFSFDDFVGESGLGEDSNLYNKINHLTKASDLAFKALDSGFATADQVVEIAKLYPENTLKQDDLLANIALLEQKGKIVEPHSVRWIDLATKFKYDNDNEFNNQMRGFNNMQHDLLRENLFDDEYRDVAIRAAKIMGQDDIKNDADIVYSALNGISKRQDDGLVGTNYLLRELETYRKRKRNLDKTNGLADKVVKYMQDNNIDVFGNRPQDMVSAFKQRTKFEAADIFAPQSITELLSGRNDSADAYMANVLTDDLIDYGTGLRMFVSDKADHKTYLDVSNSVEHLDKNYFNNVFIHFDGKDEVLNLTRKELDELGYKGYKEGQYEVKGFTQEKIGTTPERHTGIFLHNGAGKETITEEVIHTIIDKEKAKDSDLFKEIDTWKKDALDRANALDVDIPNNDELFAKSYLYNKLKLNESDETGIFNIPESLMGQIDDILGEDFIASVFEDNVDKNLLFNKLDFSKFDYMRGKIEEKNDIVKVKNLVDIHSNNFKKWFGKSQVLDYKGDALVVYKAKAENANIYFDYKSEGADKPGYLKLENPKFIYFDDPEIYSYQDNIDKYKSEGYDGLCINDGAPLVNFHYIPFKDDAFMDAYKTGMARYQLESVKDLKADDIKASGARMENALDFRERGMYENLRKENRGDVAEAAIGIDEDSGKYRVKHNEDVYRIADKILKEDGVNDTIDRLIAMPSFDPVDMATYSILVDNYSDHPKFAELTETMARNATSLGQSIQIMSTLGRGREMAMMSLAEKSFDKSYTDAQRQDINSSAKSLRRDIKALNKEAVRNIDFSTITEGVLNQGDADFALRKLNDLRHNSDFNAYLKEVAESTGKDEMSILRGEGLDYKSENENAPRYISQIQDANKVKRNINGANKDLFDARIRKAITDHYIGESQSSLYDAILDTGVSDSEARFISEAVLNRVGEATRDAKVKLFEGISEKGDVRNWEYALDDFSEANVNLKRLKGEVASAKGLAGMTKALRDSLAEVAKTGYTEKGDVLATEEALQTIKNSMPPTIGQKASTIQAMAQLFNPRTIFRNVIGNAFFGGLDSTTNNLVSPVIDSVIGKATGERTTTLRNPISLIKEAAAAGKKGALFSFDEAKKGIRSDTYIINQGGEDAYYKADRSVGKPAESKFDLPSQKTFKGGMLGRIEDGLNIALAVPDKAFANAHMQEVYNSYIAAQEKMGREITPEVVQNGVNVAVYKGLYRTFNDETNLSKSMTGIKKGLNFGKNWGIGDLVLKYAKTPSNIVMRGIDYSPVGLLKGLYLTHELMRTGTFNPVMQKEAVDAIASSLTGSAAISLGMFLASKGLLTSGDDDDKKKARSLKSSLGYISAAVNIDGVKRLIFGDHDPVWEDGDKLFDISWAPPVSAMFLAGAAINDALKDSFDAKGALKNVASGTIAGANSLLDQDVINGLLSSFKYNDNLMDSLADIFSGIPASFVPSAIGQVANALDPTRRVTKDDSFFVEMKQKLQARIPKWKEGLQAKQDVYGFDDTWADPDDKAKNLLKAFFTLSNSSRFEEDPVGMALLDVYEHTGDTGVIPSEFKNSFGKTKNKLDKDTFNEMRDYRANLLYDTLYEAIDYLPEDYDERKKELKKIIKNVDEQVKATIEDQVDSGFFNEYLLNDEGEELPKNEEGNYFDDEGVVYDENFKPIKEPDSRFAFGGYDEY